MTVRARIKGWIGAALWPYHARLAAELVLRNRRGLVLTFHNIGAPVLAGVGEGDLQGADRTSPTLVEPARLPRRVRIRTLPGASAQHHRAPLRNSRNPTGASEQRWLHHRLPLQLRLHAEAIRHSLAGGRDVYDFMASFDEYKERMATHRRDLVWARIQKPKLKFTVERKLRTVALWAAARYRAAQSGRRRPSRLEATA